MHESQLSSRQVLASAPGRHGTSGARDKTSRGPVPLPAASSPCKATCTAPCNTMLLVQPKSIQRGSLSALGRAAAASKATAKAARWRVAMGLHGLPWGCYSSTTAQVDTAAAVVGALLGPPRVLGFSAVRDPPLMHGTYVAARLKHPQPVDPLYPVVWAAAARQGTRPGHTAAAIGSGAVA